MKNADVYYDKITNIQLIHVIFDTPIQLKYSRPALELQRFRIILCRHQKSQFHTTCEQEEHSNTR